PPHPIAQSRRPRVANRKSCGTARRSCATTIVRRLQPALEPTARAKPYGRADSLHVPPISFRVLAVLAIPPDVQRCIPRISSPRTNAPCLGDRAERLRQLACRTPGNGSRHRHLQTSPVPLVAGHSRVVSPEARATRQAQIPQHPYTKPSPLDS